MICEGKMLNFQEIFLHNNYTVNQELMEVYVYMHDIYNVYTFMNL